MPDLKKAFDTVDSEILTKKLQWFGIKEMPLSWFENYLTDRKQTVQFKTEQSEERPVNCGVSRGTILGPLLFILYVNDLPKMCSKTKVILYADDTDSSCKGKKHCTNSKYAELRDEPLRRLVHTKQITPKCFQN